MKGVRPVSKTPARTRIALQGRGTLPAPTDDTPTPVIEGFKKATPRAWDIPARGVGWARLLWMRWMRSAALQSCRSFFPTAELWRIMTTSDSVVIRSRSTKKPCHHHQKIASWTKSSPPSGKKARLMRETVGEPPSVEISHEPSRTLRSNRRMTLPFVKALMARMEPVFPAFRSQEGQRLSERA